MVLLCICLEFGRDRTAVDHGSLVAGEGDGFHGEEVDDAGVVLLETDRDLHADRLLVETVEDRSVGLLEGSARAVDLVDEADARDLRLVGVAPVGLGLRLYSCDSVEYDDGAVEHAKRALHLDREVDVPWGVDDVEAELLGSVRLVRYVGRCPKTGRSGRSNCDTALALLFHPVHHGLSLVHFADLVRYAGVEKNTLSCRGLTCVDVGNDTEISYFL